MSLRSETRMNPDYQSSVTVIFLSFTSQVIGLEADFLPELFLYLSGHSRRTTADTNVA